MSMHLAMCLIADRGNSYLHTDYWKHHLIYKLISMSAAMTSLPRNVSRHAALNIRVLT